MACRAFTLSMMVAAVALLSGCNTYNGFRRDLGVDPVDPPRMTAAGNSQMAAAAPMPASPATLPRAGDISQASWAAQRTASYTSQTNTTPVDYAPAVDKKAGEEEVKPPENHAASDQRAAVKSSGQPTPIKPGHATSKPNARPSTAAAPAASPTQGPPSPAAAPTATAPMASLPAGYKPSVDAPATAAGNTALASMADKPVSSGVGPWRAHLASHRTEGAAINEWQELLKRDPKLYGQFDPSIAWVDVKDRGSFARLMIGGWADRKEADAACAKIRGPQRYCAAVAE